jgi:hypothetical protein
MLSKEEGRRLPTRQEREACKRSEGELCHGITEYDGFIPLVDLAAATSHMRDEARQSVDWHINHCQTVQACSKEMQLELPCFQYRQLIFKLNKK